jgi:hypothetical protein
MGLMSLRVRGDVTPVVPDPGISAQAKADLNMAPYSAEIAQKISVEMTKLKQNPSDPGIVAMVRQWLITEDPPTATPRYQEAYSLALNQVFMNVLTQGDPPVNTKINIGMVIKDLNAPKMNLAPTAQKLLADKCQAVVFVGEQAAWAILQVSLQNPNFTAAMRDKLLAAIVASVGANSDGPLAGNIADQAYRAIDPPQWRAGAMPQGDNLSALILSNMSLQKSRIEAYRTTGVPANPEADTYASSLLLTKVGWPAMSEDQHVQAVQLAVNLVSLMGQRAAVPGQAPNPELINALKAEGTWLSYFAVMIQDSALQAVCDQFKNLSAGMPAATIKSVCEAVFPQAQMNPEFSSLEAPPPISSGPSSAPASQPSQ